MNVIHAVQPQDATTGGTTSANGSGFPNSQGLNNMFLQLLVAQLQNQSPLDPMDPTQFVGQLAQFSELSEVTQIEQILQQAIPSTSGTGSGSGSGSTSQTASAQAAATANTTSPSVPAAMSSAAVSAAQAAVPTFNVPVTSILDRPIQGVF